MYARLIGEWSKPINLRGIRGDFVPKNTSVEGKVLKVQLWDTHGEERFQAVGSLYYRSSVGALLVYDITKYQTFANVENWLEDLRRYTNDNVFVVLVGNKSELSSLRAVSHDEAANFAERNGLGFIETSAFDNINVDLAFEKLAEGVYQNIKNGVAGYDNVKVGGLISQSKNRCW